MTGKKIAYAGGYLQVWDLLGMCGRGRPAAAPENGGRFAAGSLEVWRLGGLAGGGGGQAPTPRGAQEVQEVQEIQERPPSGRRTRPCPSRQQWCPGKVFPRRRKGAQGTGHFAVRPCGPLYRAHPLRRFRFPLLRPACGSTPPIATNLRRRCRRFTRYRSAPDGATSETLSKLPSLQASNLPVSRKGAGGRRGSSPPDRPHPLRLRGKGAPLPPHFLAS